VATGALLLGVALAFTLVARRSPASRESDAAVAPPGREERSRLGALETAWK